MTRGTITTCLIALSSLAAAQPTGIAAPAVDLRVKPLLCILDRRTPACDMTFLVSWQSENPGDFCLFNDFTESPLVCWRRDMRGDFTESRGVRDEFRYWMSPEGIDTELAAVTIEVLRVDSDDRRRRRRSRHVWDVL